MSATGQFEIILLLLAAAIALTVLATRLRLPPAAALVLGGMVLALLPGGPAIDLDPALVMVLFLPPLLLASAYFTAWREFRVQLRPILLLAVGAVLFTTFAVAVVTHFLAPALPWAVCFALGAIVSPPDAVSAKAILQRLPLPRRMLTILEGESLVNDASGLVFYRFAVAAALTGSFSAGAALASFTWLIVGGIGIGLATGLIGLMLFRRLVEPRLITAISFLAGWAAYIAAERALASGVLAVVACGLLMGWKQHEILRAQSRTEARAVWSFVVFVLEALVFILIGLTLRAVLGRLESTGSLVGAPWMLALGVTATTVVARLIWVFPATYLPHWLGLDRTQAPEPSIPLIVGWAGMRGVVSLAAALALPEALPGRDTVLFITFFVIAVTVLVQGTTLAPLIVWLKPVGTGSAGKLTQEQARDRIAAATFAWVEAEVADRPNPSHPLVADYRRRAQLASVDAGYQAHAEHKQNVDVAKRAVAQSRRTLLNFHRKGQITDVVLHALEAELDLEDLRLQSLSGE